MCNQQKFIDYVRRKCRQLNIQFRIGKGRTVKDPDGSMVEGYFLEPCKLPGELVVARKCEDFILCLAHEYTHMMQWFNEDPIYNCRDSEYYKLEKTTERDALKLLKEWKINPKRVRTAAKRSSSYLKWLKEK